MIAEHQLGTSQQAVTHEAWKAGAVDDGLLGNQSAQAPPRQFIAEKLIDAYHRIFVIYQPAFKLALLKQLKFTAEGKRVRIAASLEALNASQPIELSLAEWKEIVEEPEEEDGD
jgi:hypothetical protein